MSLILDERIASFITGPDVSMAVASRDAQLMPSLFKVCGCRVNGERTRVTLYVDQNYAAGVVRDLRAGGPVAAVFSVPATHRTLQLKGERADVAAVTPADREYVRAHFESIVAHIAALGYPEDALRCYFHYAPEQLVAVSFAPQAAFEQTPGPGAGNRLART
jgi:hypothetical protein